MDGGFGIAQELEGADGSGLHGVSEGCGLNDFQDGGKVTVRRVGVCRMFVVGVGGFGYVLIWSKHIHFGGGQTAAGQSAHFKVRADVERRGGFYEGCEGNAGIDKGAQHHVAAYAGKTLKICSTHRQ
jgi:hypothetical protein